MFSCVCCMLLRTHTFLYVWCGFRCPISPWTLTQCPICELAISPGSDSWGAGVSLPDRADSCSFPSSCPLTVEPCAASTSPECQHSCNYLELTSQALCVFPFSTPRLSSPSLFLPEDRSVYLSHICTSPLFMFPIISTFCKNAGGFETSLLQSENFAV